jgi:hypothetical protein
MTPKNLLNKLPDEIYRIIYSYVYADVVKDIKKMTYLHELPNYENDLGRNLYFHYKKIRAHYFNDDTFLRSSNQYLENDLNHDKIKRNLYFLNDKIDSYLYIKKYNIKTEKYYIKGYETKHFDDFGLEVHIHNIVTDACRQQEQDILYDFTRSKSRKIRRQVKKPKIRNTFIIQV